jgi:hypothetical protein
MVLPSHSLRIKSGVQWRAFDDGLVVYVPETCETHLLDTAWLQALAGFDAAAATAASQGSLHQAPAFTASEWQSLVDLKILDAIT